MALSDLRRVLREDGIGGAVDRELTDQVVVDAGRRFAALISLLGGRVVAVGRDCRLTSPRLQGLVCAALLDAGLDIVDLGVAPTPLLCHTVMVENLHGGVQITGGGGPPAHNGLRLYAGSARLSAVSGEHLLDISMGAPTGPPGARRRPNSREIFIANLERLPGTGGGASVVVDCGHGAVGPLLLPLLRRAGFRVHEQAAEMDGRFPTRSPDPFEAKALAGLGATVRDRGAWLGISFDPDGARLAVVDERGDPVWPDAILFLLAERLLEADPGGIVIGDFRSSPRILAAIASRSGRAMLTRPGAAALRERLRLEDALVAGDLDGHLVFGGECGGYEDAIGAALRLLVLLASQGGPLSELTSRLPADHSNRELLVPCPVTLHQAILDRLVVRADGRAEPSGSVVRIELSGGWGVVWSHPSRPALALRVGAATQAALAVVQAELEGKIKTARAEVAADG